MNNKQPIKVLVAEDHPVNRKVMSLVLDYLGIDCEMAENGKQAVDAAQPNRFSLILMDIMMPEMDGFEAAYEIRKREFDGSRHTPIIACSALDRDRVRDQCVRCGIDDFLSKPISRTELQEKIEHWTHTSLVREPVTPEIELLINRQIDENGAAISRQSMRLMYGLEQLDDILALFLTVTEALLAQLESAIENEDVAIVRQMAHEIKGSSYAVSAREMAELCLQLEIAGEEQDWPEALRIYAALGLAFARVREFVLNKKQILNQFKKGA